MLMGRECKEAPLRAGRMAVGLNEPQVHRGHDFTDAPMRSPTGDSSSIRAYCAHVPGHNFH